MTGICSTDDERYHHTLQLTCSALQPPQRFSRSRALHVGQAVFHKSETCCMRGPRKESTPGRASNHDSRDPLPAIMQPGSSFSPRDICRITSGI